MSKTLYICYFGVREPLVQTQVIPYLTEVLSDGVDISLLTFEMDLQKWTNQEIESERIRLKSKGIDWFCLTYHKWPSVPATLYDIYRGAWLVRKLIQRNGFDVLHCRLHVPSLIGAIARKFSKIKPKILFDIRGFFPEEYTDAGIWPENGWIYRSVKRIEKWLLAESDGFVVLTEKAREILFPGSSETGRDERGRPVEVIPCCVDLTRFADVNESQRGEARDKLGIRDRFVIAYVGSFGGWYLSDEMYDLFAEARDLDPSVFILILTQRNPENVAEQLKALGFGKDDFFVDSVSSDEIPYYLNMADAAVSFIKPSFSKLASSPTKNAEYLASGLPFIANPGVGDVDCNVLEDEIGVLVDGFDRNSYRAAIMQIKRLGNVSQNCRESAKRRFDLQTVGGARYRRIYRRLLG